MKTVSKMVLTLMMTVVLLGSASVAFAQDDTNVGGQNRAFRGEVTAKGESSLTVETRNNETVAVNVTTDTKIRMIGQDGEGTFDAIEVGNFVGVRGQRNDDGSINARIIIVATRAQIRRHTLVGKVLGVNLDQGTLTVQPNRDQEKTWLVKTTDDTKYRVPDKDNPTLADIEVGNHVMIVGQRDNDAENSGTARAIAVIPEDKVANAAHARGEVASIDSQNQSFTLETEDGNYTILTDNTTRYRQRGEGLVSFEEIEVGSKVVVLGQKTDRENTIQAKRVGIGAANSTDN